MKNKAIQNAILQHSHLLFAHLRKPMQMFLANKREYPISDLSNPRNLRFRCFFGGGRRHQNPISGFRAEIRRIFSIRRISDGYSPDIYNPEIVYWVLDIWRISRCQIQFSSVCPFNIYEYIHNGLILIAESPTGLKLLQSLQTTEKQTRWKSRNKTKYR